MRWSGIVIFGWLLIYAVSAADLMELPAGTPVFTEAITRVSEEMPPEILSVSNSVELLARESGFIMAHPLMRYDTMCQVKLPDGRIRYVSEELPPGAAFSAPTHNALPAYFQAVAGILFFGTIWLFYSLCKQEKLKWNSWQAAIMAALTVVFMRQFFLLIFLSGMGSFFCSPADDPGYFEVALGLLDGKMDGPWSFTMGQALWYIPFMLIMQTRDYFDIVIPFSCFSGLILAPMSLGFLLIFFRKLSGSLGAAFAATGILALMPFFFHWTLINDANVTTSFFAMPGAGGTFLNYNALIFCGFNTMSDTPAFFLLALILMLAAVLPCRWYSAIILGVLFGLALLVRINNIFYAPAIALVYALRQEKWYSKDALTQYGIAMLAVILCFAPQLYLNYRQFGGIFTFPYIMHPNRSAEGFAWDCLAENVPYLIRANYVLFWGLVIALMANKERITRCFCGIWIIPVVLFFFGYTCTTYDAVRFLLPVYGVIIFAMTSLAFWQNGEKRLVAFTAAGFGVLAVLASPDRVMNWNMIVLLPVILLVVLTVLYRKERSVFLLLIFGTVLYFAGIYYPGVLAVILVILLIRELVNMINLLKEHKTVVDR